MLPATAAMVGFMYLTDQVMAQVHAETQRARAGPAFDRAERILDAKEVPDWRGRLKEIEATFRIEHRILPMAQVADDWFMSSSGKERLAGGETTPLVPDAGTPIVSDPGQRLVAAAPAIRDYFARVKPIRPRPVGAALGGPADAPSGPGGAPDGGTGGRP